MIVIRAIGTVFLTTKQPPRKTTRPATTIARPCCVLQVCRVCTLMIVEEKDDIFIGQNTWTALQSMNRLYKIYDIPLHLESGEIVPGRLQAFSSYPARITSGDDYYTIGDHMVVQETTIGYTNKELQKYMNGKAVMQWARNSIANRLARYVSVFHCSLFTPSLLHSFTPLLLHSFTPSLVQIHSPTCINITSSTTWPMPAFLAPSPTRSSAS